MKDVVILGSTGSVGRNTLSVLSSLKDGFKVLGLTAYTNTKLLQKQIDEFHPRAAAIVNASSLEVVSETAHRVGTRLYTGIDGLTKVACMGEADIIVAATSGTSALLPLSKALKKGKRIAIANKEVIVAAGKIITSLATKRGAEIIPVDSEHSAIFQCINGRDISQVKKVYLTASGGPLNGISQEEMKQVSPQEAMNHPKWNMGRKVSVDSATLMNKGLEVIEAMCLFDLPLERIEVLIHPEAIVHSKVEFIDGAIIAQLGSPDMRLPIQYALTYPERYAATAPEIDFSGVSKLTFNQPDLEKFPCLSLAYQAARLGGSAPCVLSAANEVAVGLFLKEKIALTEIPLIVEKVLNRHTVVDEPDLKELLKIEEWAKEEVLDVL